jgi:hypothetical protein
VAVDLGCYWMLFCTVEKGLLTRAWRMLWMNLNYTQPTYIWNQLQTKSQHSCKTPQQNLLRTPPLMHIWSWDKDFYGTEEPSKGQSCSKLGATIKEARLSTMRHHHLALKKCKNLNPLLNNLTKYVVLKCLLSMGIKWRFYNCLPTLVSSAQWTKFFG